MRVIAGHHIAGTVERSGDIITRDTLKGRILESKLNIGLMNGSLVEPQGGMDRDLAIRADFLYGSHNYGSGGIGGENPWSSSIVEKSKTTCGRCNA
jgi:hypothetical protein